MAKAEFLMLAQRLKESKHDIGGWFWSEKLDGIRFFWDGGISQGIPAEDVPWANTTKDSRFKEQVISTGLWTRYGKVLRPPKWWTDKLPKLFLDGELWAGRQNWQYLSSVVKDHNSKEWNNVVAKIFDTPKPQEVFASRIIDIKVPVLWYAEFIWPCIQRWLAQRQYELQLCPCRTLEGRYYWLKELQENDVFQVHEQLRLPLTKPLDFANHQLDKLSKLGAEGLMFRKLASAWVPERTYDMLKFKPWEDDEGTVIGYTWANEGKLEGLMGSMMVSWNGKIFELSGFTNAERRMSSQSNWKPGERVPDNVFNLEFPRGSTVTFKYRELSDSGIPKEARYDRKFEG